MNKRAESRSERDEGGEISIPAGALWGARSARARERYAISGLKPHARLIDASVLLKKAAALVNCESGALEESVARAIAQAADEILNGQWRDQFVIDPYQAGSGSAHNANVNEVLANRAAEILGGQPGSYELVHPDLHVNYGQAASCFFPAAMRVAILLSARELSPALLDLERLLRRKALEFDRIVKVGRPHLRDSLPVTLGQEFNAFGSAIERSCRRIAEAGHGLAELNTGATAVGTGIAMRAGQSLKVVERLGQLTGLAVRPAEDHFRLAQTATDFLHFSASLRELSVELIKISGDLRLLSSGPQAGLREILLPAEVLEPHPVAPQALPPTSSPGLSECLSMVAYQVIGNDTAVMLASQAGQLESNVMTPLIAHNILQSMDLLRNALASFNQHCVAGITANAARCRELLELTDGPVLALSAHLGLAKAKAVAEEVAASGKTFKQVLLDQGLVPPEAVDAILSCRVLTQPGVVDTAGGAGDG